MKLRYLHNIDSWALFESEDIGFIKLVTKYRDAFKGLVDAIGLATQGADAQQALRQAASADATPEDKAAVEKIMQPVYAQINGLLDRMAYDNKMTKGKVIVSLYDKLDGGLMNAIVTVMKPFVKGVAVDQAVIGTIVNHLSEDPELKAIPIETKPSKAPIGANGQPATVNGGSLIGSVVNEIISKLGMARA
jgi:hypothetical protein